MKFAANHLYHPAPASLKGWETGFSVVIVTKVLKQKC
jgi:hypothetical protein